MLSMIVRGLILGLAFETGVQFARRQYDNQRTDNNPTPRKNTKGGARSTKASKATAKTKANAPKRARRKTGAVGKHAGSTSSGVSEST